MTTAEQADHTSSLPTSRKVLCLVYAGIAVAALVATWTWASLYMHSTNDLFGTFWRDTQANSASKYITADALLVGLAAAILMVIEARKHNVRFIWAYLVGGFVFGISVAFPLFLIARELRVGKTPKRRLYDHAAGTSRAPEQAAPSTPGTAGPSPGTRRG
jgi:hypothetical protein